MCHSPDCLFSAGSYDLTHVSSVATFLIKSLVLPNQTVKGDEWPLPNDVPLDPTSSDVAPT